MKNIFYVLSIFFFTSIFGQNNFDYQRTWATYIGPVGTDLQGTQEFKPFIFDLFNNINLTATVKTNSSFNDSYYNQFISSGSQSFNSANSINVYIAKLSPNGNFLNKTFNGSSIPVNSEVILAYDSVGNYYVSRITQNSSINIPATVGVWLPTNPTIVNNSVVDKITLSKYSPLGNLLWTTFVPRDSYGYSIKFDSQNNVYIAGQTILQSGIGSSGVYNENFIVGYDSNNNLLSNGYIVKLNSQGEKMWGTYSSTSTSSFQIYNDDIYIIGSSYFSNINVATSNTFQQSIANRAILKISSQNGTQIWGTYFGAPNNQSIDVTFAIKVNENGIFLQGFVFDYLNSGYYTTPGAFKENISGSSDLLLTKFDLNGNRVWGTFFGGTGSEVSTSTCALDVIGNNIIIAGIQQGGENLSTENAFKTTKNGGNTDMFFTKFDTDGNRIWSSYYGGADNATVSATEEINVKIKDVNTFYLFGNTSSLTDISTPNSAQPSILSPNGDTVGYVARFDMKVPLATSEVINVKDLILYDNPNNGNFTIEGDILKKKICILKIYDLAGRILTQQKMSKESKQIFNFQNKLVNGNYMVQVSAEDGFVQNYKIIVK